MCDPSVTWLFRRCGNDEPQARFDRLTMSGISHPHRRFTLIPASSAGQALAFPYPMRKGSITVSHAACVV